MRREILFPLFLVFSLFLAFTPKQAQAGIFTEWAFETAADVDAWRSVGFSEASIQGGALTFTGSGEVAIYRPLPQGFQESVDALEIGIDGEKIEKVELQLLRTDLTGTEITKRFRLDLQLFKHEDGSRFAYVPFSIYDEHAVEKDTFALKLMGENMRVRFTGVKFHTFSIGEKLAGVWRSFWTLSPFGPHSINLLVGPVVIPDIGELKSTEEFLSRSVSVNAYFMVGLALLGILFLFHALWLSSRGAMAGNVLLIEVKRRFFLCALAIWLFYDVRMGMEFLRAVGKDRVSFVTASAGERTFRDNGRFHDFARFVAPLVADRKQYEVFLSDIWPYLGALRYGTYPATPNAEAVPVSDTWVVYDRPDIVLSDSGQLTLLGQSVTAKGTVLGWFGEGSFVFRELSPKKEGESSSVPRSRNPVIEDSSAPL